LDKICATLRDHGKYISHAYVLRRILKADNQVHDYVLAFETKRLTIGDKSQAVIDELAQQEFPMRLFIVYLGSDTYKGFRKSIKRMNIPPLQC
jgi:hypothetical protein